MVSPWTLLDPPCAGIRRKTLESGYQALHAASLHRRLLSNSATAVAVGVQTHEWGSLVEQLSPYLGTGASNAIVANRVSFVLGLKGPSLSVDTACSSALVAQDAACKQLRAVCCTRALVVGVQFNLTVGGYVGTCAARMLCADGRCKTFDSSANGYARGEGCGAAVLVTQASACGDGFTTDGCAVNQDGRTATLTAPNGPSQQAVITSALLQAATLPRSVCCMEAHGTGTALGDPIEVGSLKAVLGLERQGAEVLACGAVKSGIGHLEAAAGDTHS